MKPLRALGTLYLACAALGFASAALASAGDHLLYRVNDGHYNQSTFLDRSNAPKVIGIPADLSIDWDRDKLLAEVNKLANVVPAGDPLMQRIELMQRTAESIKELQRKLVTFTQVYGAAAAANRPSDATRAGDDLAGLGSQARGQLSVLEAEGERDAALGKALDAAFQTHLDALAKQGTLDAERLANINYVWRTLGPVNAAILVPAADYTFAIEVLTDTLTALTAELNKEVTARLARGQAVNVRLWAVLTTESGAAIPLDLPLYAPVDMGPELPQPPCLFVLDQRTRDEVKAAANLGAFIGTIRNGAFASDVSTAYKELRESLSRLVVDAKADLDQRLTAVLKKIDGLGNAQLNPIRDQLAALKQSIDSLPSLVTADGDPGDDLLKVADSLLGSITTAESVISRLKTLANDNGEVEKTLQALPADVKEQVEGDIGQLLNSTRAALLKDGSPTGQLIARMRTLAESLGLLGHLGLTGDQLSKLAVPQSVLNLPPTKLHVPRSTASVQPHSGEYVTLQMSLVTDGREIARDSQQFRLRHWGWYPETRGTLLFVDPRSALTRKLSYEPVPGVLFNLRNDSLPWASSLGASLSLQDLTDDSSLELGIGGHAAFFDDLLCVGYGRNLQAGADFFYVGINPLALFSLLRK